MLSSVSVLDLVLEEVKFDKSAANSFNSDISVQVVADLLPGSKDFLTNGIALTIETTSSLQLPKRDKADGSTPESGEIGDKEAPEIAGNSGVVVEDGHSPKRKRAVDRQGFSQGRQLGERK